MGEHLIIKKIPAVTIVAACIKAETGVGPSIASGNQVCNPICADLPTEPINNKKQIILIILNGILKTIINLLAKNGIKANTTE
jgi:hypothetical protein